MSTDFNIKIYEMSRSLFKRDLPPLAREVELGAILCCYDDHCVPSWQP